MLRIRVSEKQAFAAFGADAFIEREYAVPRNFWVEAIDLRDSESVRAMLHAWLGPLTEANRRSETLAARAVNIFFAASGDLAEPPLRIASVEQVMAQGRAEAGDVAQAERHG